MLQIPLVNRMAIAVLLVLGALLALAPAALAAPFSVDMTGDAGDSNPGDGACRNSLQRCSVRAAIQESNALAGPDTVNVPYGHFALTLSSPPAPIAGMFTVDMTGDAVDADPGDGACRTSAGKCSLRAAVQESNALYGPEMVTVPAGTYSLTLEEPVDPSEPPTPPPPPPGYPGYPGYPAGYPEWPEPPEPPEPPEYPEWPEPPEPPEYPEWPEPPEPPEPVDPEDLLPEQPFPGIGHYFPGINQFFPFESLLKGGLGGGGGGKAGAISAASRLALSARPRGGGVRVSGRVKLPAALTGLADGARALGVDVRRQACNGRVTITLKAGRRTVGRRRASVKGNCRFSARVRVGGAGRGARLRATARFRGNGLLGPAQRSVRVRAGR